jgi:membrane protein YqaA with SNARE-associated domain
MSANDSKVANNSEIKARKFWTTKNTLILIGIASFIAILAALAISGINLGQIFNSWTDNYYILFGAIGVYVIIFLISTFANMTILFPVPYAVALAYIALRIYNGTIIDVNIWLLGIVAGSGAAIGEITAYYLGKGSAALMESKEKSESVERMKARIKKGWAVPLMFLCAATFIPDDPLLILLGYCGYPLWKMLVTYFAGKIVLCVSTIYLVILAQDVPVVGDFFWILGISDKPVDPWFSFLGWAGVLILFFLIFFVDWTSQLKKLYRKISKNKKSDIEASD